MDGIKEGSIVTIDIDGKIEKTYIIVSEETYQEIKFLNKPVPYNFVVKESKIGKALMGRSMGEIFNLEPHIIEILSVTYSI